MPLTALTAEECADRACSRENLALLVCYDQPHSAQPSTFLTDAESAVGSRAPRSCSAQLAAFQACYSRALEIAKQPPAGKPGGAARIAQ